MLQQIVLPKYNSLMEEQLIKLFHESNLPLHFNKTGNKEFTNYQRISIIILFFRSKKSLRDFIVEFQESKWISYLGLKKIPQKSTLHDWLKLFDMQIIRKIGKVLLPKKIELTSIDGTVFDSWQRSRHYEKRADEISPLPHMPYAKAGIFIDVKTQIILDFDFIMSHKHDVKIAEKIFKRNKIKDIIGLGDKRFDSENLHKIARANGIEFYAPVREMDKRSLKKRPSGFYRRKCIELPQFKGMRSIVETVNSVLKRTQIHYLRSKKHFMREREFAWNIVLYNVKRRIKISHGKLSQTFFVQVCSFIVFGQSLSMRKPELRNFIMHTIIPHKSKPLKLHNSIFLEFLRSRLDKTLSPFSVRHKHARLDAIRNPVYFRNIFNVDRTN